MKRGPKQQKRNSLSLDSGFLGQSAADERCRRHRYTSLAFRRSYLSSAAVDGDEVKEKIKRKEEVKEDDDALHNAGVDGNSSPNDDGCQYNLCLTHLHCVRENCTSVCFNISNSKTNLRKRRTTISKEITTTETATSEFNTKSFRRYRSKEDCATSFCIYSGLKTAHFHCSLENCQFTFKNESDLAKHQKEHVKKKGQSRAIADLNGSLATVNSSSILQKFNSSSVDNLQKLWTFQQQQMLQQHRAMLSISMPSTAATTTTNTTTTTTTKTNTLLLNHETASSFSTLKHSCCRPMQITSIDGFFNRKRGRPPKNRFVEVYKSTQETPQAIFTSFKLEKQQQQLCSAYPDQNEQLHKDGGTEKKQQLEPTFMQNKLLALPPMTSTIPKQQPQQIVRTAKNCLKSRCKKNKNKNNCSKNSNNKYNMQQQAKELECNDATFPALKTRDYLQCGNFQRQVSPFDFTKHTCATVAVSENLANLNVSEDMEMEKVSVVRAAGTYYPENLMCGHSNILMSPQDAQRLLLTFKRPTEACHTVAEEEMEKDVEIDATKEGVDKANEEQLSDLEDLPQDLSVNALSKATLVTDENDDIMSTSTDTLRRYPQHLSHIINFYQQQKQQLQQQQFLIYGHAAVAAALTANTLLPAALPSLRVPDIADATAAIQALDPLTDPSSSAASVSGNANCFDMATFLKKVAAMAATQQSQLMYSPKNDNFATALSELRDDHDRIPSGFLKYRFHEDCGFARCGYRKHQSHYHCNRRDCYYSFCDKTRFVQHTARHDRLDTLMGDDFQHYRSNMCCGYVHCSSAATTTNMTQIISSSRHKLKKLSHFHCLKCDFICSDTNKLVAHRRLHSKLEYIRLAGFRKVGSNEECQVKAAPSTTELQVEVLQRTYLDTTVFDNPVTTTGVCSYNMRHTHYHCLICGCSVLSRAQLATHKHK